MSELIDKMGQQFDQMKAIAEENYKMAEQAIKERDQARDALRECLRLLRDPDASEFDANNVETMITAVLEVK